MIKLITPPALEPITLADAKEHLRIDGTADDAYLTGLISVARETCENYTRMAFLTQTWDMVLDATGFCIDLPRPPLQSVTGIYVTDDVAVETTVDPLSYRVDMISEPGRVFLKPGYTWPYYTSPAGFRVRYTAGYTTAASVPNGLRKAVKLLTAYLYENRGEAKGTITFAGQMGQLPDDVKIMLDPFKVYL